MSSAGAGPVLEIMSVKCKRWFYEYVGMGNVRVLTLLISLKA
jgi:hypothetical protein